MCGGCGCLHLADHLFCGRGRVTGYYGDFKYLNEFINILTAI